MRTIGVAMLAGAVLAACAPATTDTPRTVVTSSSGGSSGGMAPEQGEPGGACYANSTCNLGSLCRGGLCGADTNQGHAGAACYPNSTCDSGLTCVAMVCTAGGSGSSGQVAGAIGTGEEGGRCFPNQTCFTGLECRGNVCVGGAAVGAQGGPCYANHTCNAGLACASGQCVPAPVTSSSGPAGNGSSSGGVMAPTARQFFDTNVVPILQARCSVCHETARAGPDFLGAATTDFYAKIVAYRPATATSLITHDPEHTSILVVKGAHAGPAFRSEPPERIQVITWLNLEVAERGITAPAVPDGGTGGSGGPPVTADGAIGGFGNCMLRADFDAVATGTTTKYADVPNQNSTEGRCYACHTVGAGGAYLSVNPDDLYTFTRIRPYVLKLALPSQNTDGTYTMVPANRFRDHGGEPGTHPRYIMAQTRVQAIDQLVNRTLARFNANTGNCRTQGSP